VKILAYIIYFVLCLSSMTILNHAGVGCNQWEFWAIAFGYATSCVCGWIACEGSEK
jgi:hypothetical protein